jgi:hypothetical protein
LFPSPHSNAADANSPPLTQRSVIGPHIVCTVLIWATPSQGTWQCKGADSGTVFDNVEFEEGEWVDYDEKVTVPTTYYWISMSLTTPFCGVGELARICDGNRDKDRSRLINDTGTRNRLYNVYLY